MLYDKLDYLKEKVLYFDTDSIIYIDDGTKNIKTGDMLGEMTDELSGNVITQYISNGPKYYSLKFDDNNKNRQSRTACGYCCNYLECCSKTNHTQMT